MKTPNVILSVLIMTLFISCKKKITPAPALDYYMIVKFNGEGPIKYTHCSETETTLNNHPETHIAGHVIPTVDYSSGELFDITLFTEESNLKTGQVYKCQIINSENYYDGTSVAFGYYPRGEGDFGENSPQYNPIGTATLTEVTSTSIKGTFSVYFGNPQGTMRQDTATTGSFYCKRSQMPTP